MNKTAMELQKNIVVALARSIKDPWERIVVNYEVPDEDGGLTEDHRGFTIIPEGAGNFRKGQLSFDTEMKYLFRELRAEIQRSEGQGWGTCDLVVDQTGRFRFNFSYNPPKRINGIFDEQSMGRFDRYLDTYKAEQADT